ncbi:MAG: hypothetical protein LWX83_17220 [Anaerolineae bacterium]|nr:hypothetical protein [Anaerolineae bacterium]
MIEKKEFKFVIYFVIFIFILTTLPYFLGFAVQGQNWQFSGFVFGVEDGNSYIAKMLTGANGAWLFKTPYSGEEQRGFLAFLPYLLLGKLTSAPGQHEQLVVLFHLFRLTGILFLAVVSYVFISTFLCNVIHRRLVLALSMAGGGLGWLVLLAGGNNPLELYSPETFGFLSVYGLPHLLFSRALLILGLYGFMNWDKNIKQTLLIAALWGLMGFFQPLTITIGWAVLGAYLLVWCLSNLTQKKGLFEKNWFSSLRAFLIIMGLTSSWVIYNFLSFQWDPYLQGWYAQNIILSPSPVDYVFSLGIFVPLALWGVITLIKTKNNNGYLLIAWLLIFPILIYLPTNVQRRMADGFWLVLLILSAVPLAFKINLRPQIWIAGSIPLWISSLILLVGGIMAVLNPAQPIFVSRDAVNIFYYLRQNAGPGESVLASYDLSNPLPAWTPQRVVTGHGPESIHFKEVLNDIDSFYQTQDDLLQLKIIQKYHPSFILFTDGKTSKNSFLTRVYTSGEYSLYKVHGENK